jgi:hypothetical protein
MIGRWLAVGFLCLSSALSATAQDAVQPIHGADGVPDPIRRALAAVDRTPDALSVDRRDMGFYGGDRWRLQTFDAFLDAPLRIPGDVEVWQHALSAAAEHPADLFGFASARLGTSVRRGLLANPVTEIRAGLDPRAPLPVAIRALWKQVGRPFPPEEREALRASLRDLPDSLEIPVAILVTAASKAIAARDEAIAPLRRGPSEVDLQKLERDAVKYVVGSDAGNLEPSFNRRVEEAAASIDSPLWNAGIADLLLAIDATLPALRRHAAGIRRDWRVDTPAGAIVLATSRADRHAGDSPLLLIDAGGNDVYETGGSASFERPVSILIDLGGNDTYTASDTLRPSFGAGVLGAGILVDTAGNDSYRCGHIGLGAGLYGTGILIDLAGDDVYDGITGTQGAGIFGIGILADVAGNDRYHAFQQAQGYGYVRGSGLLVDRQGNDRYVADDTKIRYPSAQSKEHNSSLAQGFGFGKRSDYLDGHSLAGGFGMLADGAGDDTYRCGVFGQGGGYWYGVGVLADAAGSDAYDGVWYVQGAAAHFAIGILWDGSGDDRYHATMNMAQGAGHDFSLGLLYERAGADRYEAPNLSLGGGNANGIGFFWDVAGDDVYNVEAGTTLGRANIGSRGGLRDRMETLGLFVDTGGRDAYPAGKPFARNGGLWTQSGTDVEHPLDTERGAGIDTTWVPGAGASWRTAVPR